MVGYRGVAFTNKTMGSLRSPSRILRSRERETKQLLFYTILPNLTLLAFREPAYMAAFSRYVPPVEDIDHIRTRANSPQPNGICERFHRTVLD